MPDVQVQAKLAETPDAKQFDFSEMSVFGKFDSLCRRLDRMQDVRRTFVAYVVSVCVCVFVCVRVEVCRVRTSIPRNRLSRPRCFSVRGVASPVQSMSPIRYRRLQSC